MCIVTTQPSTLCNKKLRCSNVLCNVFKMEHYICITNGKNRGSIAQNSGDNQVSVQLEHFPNIHQLTSKFMPHSYLVLSQVFQSPLSALSTLSPAWKTKMTLVLVGFSKHIFKIVKLILPQVIMR